MSLLAASFLAVVAIAMGSPLNGIKAVERMNILGGDTHDYLPHHAAVCDQYKLKFEQFKVIYRPPYRGVDEETMRFKIFCNNMEKAKVYQSMDQGSAVYGASVFADMTEEEFSSKYLTGLNGQQQSWPSAEIPKGAIPTSFDWRDHGAVTAVKNQGSCGSCWAFSTTGNVEGQFFIKNKTLISLSEQELVDCDKMDSGCEGGLPSTAYKAIMQLGGLEPEKDYSYKGVDETCEFKKADVAVKVTGAVNISSDESAMAAWLQQNGPISIGINAFAMQFYMGGIAHPWKIFCNPSKLDHGVLIVGYGVQDSEPFWIIKNSWGATWGRQGYYYVFRGDGVCGLNTMCTSSTVA